MAPAQFAHTDFFVQRARNAGWVFARLPVSVEQAYALALHTSAPMRYCSCAFWPKPCWHVQALALLLDRAGLEAFEAVDVLPDWAAALIGERPPAEAATQNSKLKTPNDHIGQPEQQPFARLERARNGFDDLETWLLDTLSRGAATAVSEDADFCQTIAARLADASMRGLSRSLRTLGTVPADHPDWPVRVTAALAEAALALHAFHRREQLSPPLLHDLEAFVGFSQKKDAIRAEGEALNDTWAVVGAVEDTVEEPLRRRRTWLLGAESKRFALLLEYAHGNDVEFLPGFAPGAVVAGELVFYPSAWPHRAVAADHLRTVPRSVEKLPGFEKIADLARTFAAALGQQPWLAALPAVLNAVVPVRSAQQFGLTDADGNLVPLANSEPGCWSLVTLGGGRPITVFGEWNGTAFLAFSAIADQRLTTLPN